jgi:hypothetical protein
MMPIQVFSYDDPRSGHAWQRTPQLCAFNSVLGFYNHLGRKGVLR